MCGVCAEFVSPMPQPRPHLPLIAVTLAASFACSGNAPDATGSGGASLAGASNGGLSSFGGASLSGGNGSTTGGATMIGSSIAGAGATSAGATSLASSGGATNVGNGGSATSGGTNATGGAPTAGGTQSTAGAATNTGGSPITGGRASTGGSASPGGSTNQAGAVSTGGTKATGGSASNGGSTASAGTSATGGSSAGGASGTSRTIQAFDKDWLFNFGDASGASATAFADSAWRHVNVPHDWSIEGPNPPANPFSQTAATTGRGGYLPSGISWYRKHFTLPQTLSGQKVYFEFDGVMANSDVYVNGAHIGHHPYGYVSFRYDVTANVQFGTADNVIAVKTDTTTQPASRFYAGAGIYRHVRMIATSPVHVDQYATYVTTPAPTTQSATVHVTTSVVNSGTAAANVSVQGIVSDPSGIALSPVTSAAQSIAAGAAATLTFDVAVANPKLWDLSNPNMYQLMTNVLVAGVAVDNDVTPFGIREIKFNAGMTLNGKAVKFQGVCLHEDYHGLGLAAPQRAMQRRLAQLKIYGVNAIRTAHEPPSPDFLELTDRMGFLVLDEFTDVWTAHKYTDVGDYAAYFNQTGTTPTGMPTVPTVTGVSPTGAPWWQVDFTGWMMRDRNHPSVALYSMGNEIHDSLATRTPILTKMVAMSHYLDPSRSDTQALLDPATAGDVGGATNTLLDVWGDNYDVTSALTAMVNAPTKSGLITEMGTATSTWATVTANAGLTGLFMWTGVDYLGEADTLWPTVGSSAGILDELGTPKSLAFSWQTTWGLAKTTFATGATAGKVVVTADHSSLTTDLNDVAYVKAAVPTATAPVAFAVAGPGIIIAVDSGSQTQETFRGNTRNAFGNLAFAIVQATGPGTITVTATSAGLTDGTATIQATDGTFVPCSGTCD